MSDDTYTIYAVPKNKKGTYRVIDTVTVHMQEFETLEEMEAFWLRSIVPASSTRYGRDFELAMIINRNSSDFRPHKETRYADRPILESADSDTEKESEEESAEQKKGAQ